MATSALRPRLATTWLAKPSARVALLALLALSAIIVFMTLEASGSWSFIIPFRGRKVIAMLIVACAISVSTVLFQSISHNRILTPSIMGFDALYLLIQTVAVFWLGSTRLILLDERLRFGIEVALMVMFASALYWWLFVATERGLHLLLLVGVIFAVMFRSVTSLLQRMIDPVEFSVLQDLGFASFNSVNRTLLLIASILIIVCLVVVWRMTGTLDALALGKETAINLGVDYTRWVMIVLSVVTVMVSVSTALVGPITFFGLLVANMAYAVAGKFRHRLVLPVAALLAIIALIGGQTIFERVFEFNTSLSIIIEFAGGLMFIYLLIRGAVR